MGKGRKRRYPNKRANHPQTVNLSPEKLRTETDFLKYMKLLKGFAQKYCVMIVVKDTPVGPATTRDR